MYGDEKNQKDTPQDSSKDIFSIYTQKADLPSPSPLVVDNHNISYTKAHKLITALYMVTDIMQKDEPIRLKLRTLGVEILSDINLSKKSILEPLNDKINAVMSFLNIASDMRMISEMNCNILMKEFTELKNSIKDFLAQKNGWLEDYISREDDNAFGQDEDRILREREGVSHKSFTFYKGHSVPNGQYNKGQGTRLGVQKASTLMSALNNMHKTKNSNDANEVKDKRRAEIISIIKDMQNTTNFTGVNVSDIKKNAKGTLTSIGEKTLQRELISMVSTGLLRKTGSKRWSRYYLA